MEHHEYLGLNALLFVVVTLVCLLIGGLLHKWKVYYLPQSGAIMIFGFAIGLLFNFAPYSETSVLSFNPELFYFVLLPPIIFSSGYQLKRKSFFNNLGTIIAFAVLGTIITCIVFGYILYATAILGWIPLNANSPLESLLFGALISATDPIASIALLSNRELQPNRLLHSIIFGESVLNDAIGIVLYRSLDGFYAADQAGQSFDFLQLLKALGTFLLTAVGSFSIGVAVALLCCYILKRIKVQYQHDLEFSLVFLFAYASYLLAEVAYLSGILSLFFNSICMAHYNYYNLSASGRVSTTEAFKSLAQIAEALIFIYVGLTAGLSVYALKLTYSASMIAITIVACMLGRAANVYPTSLLVNMKRRPKLGLNLQHALNLCGGLRGAVAFSLAVNFSGDNREYVITSTLILVLFTTLVMGGLALPVLQLTGMTNRGRNGSFSPNTGLLPATESHVAELSTVPYQNNHGTQIPTQTYDLEVAQQTVRNSNITLTNTTSHSRIIPPPLVRQSMKTNWLVSKFKKFDHDVLQKTFGGELVSKFTDNRRLSMYDLPNDKTTEDLRPPEDQRVDEQIARQAEAEREINSPSLDRDNRTLRSPALSIPLSHPSISLSSVAFSSDSKPNELPSTIDEIFEHRISLPALEEKETSSKSVSSIT